MANAKIRGITVEIGGDTTKLGKALQNSETSTRSLQSELRQVEKLLQLDPSNVDLVAQRQRILSQAVEETSEKLRILEKAEQQVIDQFNRGDIGEDQLRAFQREIIETQNKLSKFEGDLDGTGDAIKKVGDSAEESSEGFTVFKGALADIVSNVIQSAVSSIGNLVGSLLELSEATEEYRTMQAKLEGSSKTFGYSVEFAKDKYEEFYSYVGDDQMATNAITNLMGIGTSTDSISKLAEGATAVWASYGDSIPIEGLTEAINETITVGKVTGGMADTINWAKNANEGLKTALEGNKTAQKAYNDAIKEGLPVEDAFNEALAKITDEQERADVVAKFLNVTYGESKTAYDELNKSVLGANEAELALKDTQAQLGEAVAPVNTAITDLKNQALEAILPLVENLAKAFLDMYEYLQKNPEVVKALTTVVIALGTAFTVLAGTLAIQGLINGVTKAFALLNTTMLANPAVLVTALITGIVAGFIYLWNNCDAFRKFWIDLWEKIKSVCSKAVDWLKGLPDKIWSAIQGAISRVSEWGNQVKNKATTAITNMVSSVVTTAQQIPGKIYNAIYGAISKLASWGVSMYNTAKNAMSNVAKIIIDTIKDLPEKIMSIGGDIVTGLWNGISSGWGWLRRQVSNLAHSLLESAKDALGIESPSKEFRDQVGKYIAEGIGVGITDNADSPINALNDLSDEMLNGEAVLNGATINRKLATTFTAQPIGGINNSLLSKLDGIYERLNRLQIVLDTGTLVGETIDKIDAGLANRQLLSARGV